MASVIGVTTQLGAVGGAVEPGPGRDHGPFIGGCTTCRGVVTVNDDGTVTKEPDYWALGHASRFVQPGAVRIGLVAASDHASRHGGARADECRVPQPGRLAVLIAHNATSRPLDVRHPGRRCGTSWPRWPPGPRPPTAGGRPDRLQPVDDLGWVDLDYGPGPSGTPGGRLMASVGPEVVGALAQVKLGEQWLAYSLPYGAELVRPDWAGHTVVAARVGRLSAYGTVTVPEHPLANMIDGNRGTRWSSGVGQREGMSLTVDLVRNADLLRDRAGRGPASAGLPPPLHGSDLRRRRTWTDIAVGPGRPSLTGEMVIALPPTTTRHLRLVSGATSLSSWSIHELNLRNSAAADDPVPPNESLVVSTGVLPDGTTVTGHYNPGPDSAAVPFPVRGFGYGYRLPPTAAVTYAVLGTSPAAGSDRDDLPPGQRGGPSPRR